MDRVRNGGEKGEWCEGWTMGEGGTMGREERM